MEEEEGGKWNFDGVSRTGSRNYLRSYSYTLLSINSNHLPPFPLISSDYFHQVFFYLVPALQGPVDLPWWSIWLPLVFGGIGVVGFAALEDKKAVKDQLDAKKRASVNVDSSDETQPLLVTISTGNQLVVGHVGYTHY